MPKTTNEDLYGLLTILHTQVIQMNADFQAKNDALEAHIATLQTAIVNAVTLMQGLAAQLAAAKTPSTTTDPAVLTAMDTATAAVDAKTQELNAAVVANTPA